MTEIRIKYISIHAPNTGSDSNLPVLSFRLMYFNPRSQYRERRSIGNSKKTTECYFNPRSQYRERRCGRCPVVWIQAYFNPRSQYRERLLQNRLYLGEYRISIHAPNTGSDKQDEENGVDPVHISIHAPNTGSDRRHQRHIPHRFSNFNPRSQYRERR